MKDRGLGRRRQRNFRAPRDKSVAQSIEQLVDRARELANRDHGGALASRRELDRLAEVYLARAFDRLRGGKDAV